VRYLSLMVVQVYCVTYSHSSRNVTGDTKKIKQNFREHRLIAAALAPCSLNLGVCAHLLLPALCELPLMCVTVSQPSTKLVSVI
jgi:hypothetical protein